MDKCYSIQGDYLTSLVSYQNLPSLEQTRKIPAESGGTSAPPTVISTCGLLGFQKHIPPHSCLFIPQHRWHTTPDQQALSGLFWWGLYTINSARYPRVTSHLVSSSQRMFRLVYVHRNPFKFTCCEFNFLKNIMTIQSTSIGAQPEEGRTMRPFSITRRLWQSTVQRCKREGCGTESSRPLLLRMKSHFVWNGSIEPN